MTESDTRTRIEKQTHARRIARVVIHEDPPPAIIRKRKRLEKSLKDWIVFFGGDAFDSPFSGDQEEELARTDDVIKTGGLYCRAAPRGDGKTTRFKWGMVYAVLTGRRKYMAIIAATGELAIELIEFVRMQLQESDLLHKYYPHVTTYVRATDGKAIKARYQLRRDMKPSGIRWGKSILILPKAIDENGNGYPSNGAIIEGRGLTGAIRGLWKDGENGRVLRPDFVMIDDPQTRESAESDSQCNMRERVITGDVLGLAGPKKRIAAVMACTVVREGDTAHRFLDRELHPEWRGKLTQMVNAWPDAQETLWVEYATIYKDEGEEQATGFYRANRKAMDAGHAVSWEHRVRDGELSALQTAENLLLETGDQFHAEYQNDPKPVGVTLYTLTPKTIMARADNDRKRGQVPEWSTVTLAATDINPSYGLTTVIAVFGSDQRAAVVWYAVHKTSIDDNTPDAQKKAAIMAALQDHGKELAALPCRPDRWIIDGGGSPKDTVITFCDNSVRTTGLNAVTAFGRAWRQFRPKKKDRKYEEIFIRSETRHKQWAIFNADYWREIAQKSWLGAIGAPGSCDLHAGNHRPFAEQICREPLKGKSEVAGVWVYIWDTLSGAHDYGDCMTMLFALASIEGIGTGGAVQRKKKKIARVVVGNR
jgi:hypothetical protein